VEPHKQKAAPVCLAADEHEAPAEELKLQGTALDLLLAEMRQHAQTIQSLAASLAGADWNAIVSAAARIKPAYFVDLIQPTLRKEVERQLSAEFVRQYREMHGRAENLRQAAVRQDPEAAAFQYFRVLESCIECHSEYAPKRFPGLAGKGHGQHRD
jgi:hypothetical protein